MKRYKSLCALVVITLLVACQVLPGQNLLIGSRWKLTAKDGKISSKGKPPVEITDSVFTVRAILRTQRGCEQRVEIYADEYVMALQKARTYRLDQDALHLLDADEKELLTFGRDKTQ